MTALVAAIALVLTVAAVRSMRRRDAAEERGEAGEAAPERDEDPLSREAAEWERYAGELAAAGRRREAIRAWYHAVLVALFRAGRLHHQRGPHELGVRRTGAAGGRPGAPRSSRSPRSSTASGTAERRARPRPCASAPRGAREVLRSLRGEAPA